MSVIAWDGHTLAADRRCSFGAYIGTMTKIRHIGFALVAASGTAARAAAFFAWVQRGCDPATYSTQDSNNYGFTGLVIRPGPVIERYESFGYPIVIDGPQHAIGSGRDYAAMAMHLGKTAAEAVQLAAIFDENCGNGVDTLTLDFAPTGLDSARTPG